MKNTYVGTMQEIARLQAVAEQLRKNEIPGVIARIREAIDAYGFTVSDLWPSVGASPSAPRRQAVVAKPLGAAIGVPKYRDPKSGKTWTGRGKPPAWIAGAKDREAFALDAGAGASRSGTKAAKSPGPAPVAGQPRYRDPATGRTWTGRGKPPSWIATAKNRDEFAIPASTSSDSSDSAKATATA